MKEYYVHTTVQNIEKMADASKAKLQRILCTYNSSKHRKDGRCIKSKVALN